MMLSIAFPTTSPQMRENAYIRSLERTEGYQRKEAIRLHVAQGTGQTVQLREVKEALDNTILWDDTLPDS